MTVISKIQIISRFVGFIIFNTRSTVFSEIIRLVVKKMQRKYNYKLINDAINES